MKFNHLLQSIQQTHEALQTQAVAAVNRSLTIRNWLISFYIVIRGTLSPIFSFPILGTVSQELEKTE